jgi:hypothetical protein
VNDGDELQIRARELGFGEEAPEIRRRCGTVETLVMIENGNLHGANRRFYRKAGLNRRNAAALRRRRKRSD